MTSRLTRDAFMPCVPAGDAVVDGDGVELHRRAAGFANTLLNGCGYFTEMEVAGADFWSRVLATPMMASRFLALDAA